MQKEQKEFKMTGLRGDHLFSSLGNMYEIDQSDNIWKMRD